MVISIADAKDIMAIVGPWVSPLFGAWIAIHTVKRAERGRLTGFVSWAEAGDPNQGQPETLPFVHVQNLSGRPIAITDVRFVGGYGSNSQSEYWGLYDEDGDYDPFPRMIEPGKITSFRLDPKYAMNFAGQSGKIADLLARLFKRQRIRIKVLAMSGEKLIVGGEAAIASRFAHPAFSGF